jgi:hypothetical protein
MVKIYTLTHRSSPRVYIGKTVQTLGHRLAGHIREAKESESSNHRLNWIRSLLSHGLKPDINIIAEVDDDKWSEKEKFYIKLGWQIYPNDMLNDPNYPGGDKGPVGYKNPEELIIRRAKNRRLLSTESLKEIARRRNNGEFLYNLVKEYGVSRDTIMRGLRGQQLTGLNIKVRKSSRSGSNAYQVKISNDTASEIRSKYSTGKYTQKQLAQEYGVVQGTIFNVLSEKIKY